MKIKDAIALYRKKERLAGINTKQPLDIYKHVGTMPFCDEQYIVKLFAEGNTYEQIAKKTGYHLGTIGRKIRKHKEAGLIRCNMRPGSRPFVKIPELLVA